MGCLFGFKVIPASDVSLHIYEKIMLTEQMGYNSIVSNPTEIVGKEKEEALKKKVVVGMSGGVDSSVAAYLLKEQGYDVIGVTMNIWQEEDRCRVEENGGCCGLSAVEDARRVAAKLDIPYYVMNFKESFKKHVMDYFVEEYLQGRTPNPCNACNRYVKWEALLNRAIEIGADYIATGHYARIAKLENGRYSIMNSVTARKDQTYALYNLTQEQLAHTLMPVGAYEKDEIRKIAENIGLVVANKKDSQDICFIPDGDYAGFIERTVPDRIPGPGDFVLSDGTVVGKHKGITHYTIGQRRGLEVAVGKRIFVNKIDVEKNQIILGDDDEVFTTSLVAGDMNYMAVPEFKDGEKYLAKIRYSHNGTVCSVTNLSDGKVRLDFEEPVRAVTPGQAVVLYQGEFVAGGGTILG